MEKNLGKFFNPLNYWRAAKRRLKKKRTATYSQLGEDLLIRWVFKILDIRHPTYLDIGANEPAYDNNTYLLYTSGSRGVCVEPNPALCGKIKRVRPRDAVVNAGIGADGGTADFYIMDSHRLNTFSKDEAERIERMGHTIKDVKSIDIVSVNAVIKEHFAACPHLVSLDTESMDYGILKSFDFEKYRPEVFCIETLTYEKTKGGRKIAEIMDLMEEKGYLVFADTHLNTVFVDAAAWKKAGADR